MKHIAVLLTVFNRKEKTLLCLKNLYQQTIPYEYQMDIYLLSSTYKCNFLGADNKQ